MAGRTPDENSAELNPAGAGSRRRTRKKSAADLEDWRVEGLPSERAPSGGQPTDAGAPAPPSPSAPTRKSSRASEWLPATGRKRRRSGTANGNGRAGVKELERRTAELEKELRSERRRAREEIAKLRGKLREQNSAGFEQESPVTPTGRLDANAASFEQFRELGLTPAQCAKLIARRESAGGFKTKAELRRIPGLSKSARELIEERLSVPR